MTSSPFSIPAARTPLGRPVNGALQASLLNLKDRQTKQEASVLLILERGLSCQKARFLLLCEGEGALGGHLFPLPLPLVGPCAPFCPPDGPPPDHFR